MGKGLGKAETMSRNVKNALVTAAAAIVLATLACGGSKPARFYLIQPASTEPGSSPAASLEEKVVVGLLPLKMPDYLMRAQIATHRGVNRVDYAEFDRWAEPIADNISRVVVSDLDRSLAGTTLVEYPWLPTLSVRYRLSLDIKQFDLYADGRAELTVVWAIAEGREGPWILFETIRLTETFEEDKKPDYNLRVEALNRLVTGMNRQLADRLDEFLNGRTTR
jgi:uncharacterized lipoprotein YmbA